jgi:Mlc titration factor MtfA (ptsG expression regulator)
MMKNAPDLYSVLKEYYRQDPALRAGKNFCAVENGKTS